MVNGYNICYIILNIYWGQSLGPFWGLIFNPSPVDGSSLMDPWVELTGHRHPPGAPPEKPRLRIQVVNERSAKKQK